MIRGVMDGVADLTGRNSSFTPRRSSRRPRKRSVSSSNAEEHEEESVIPESERVPEDGDDFFPAQPPSPTTAGKEGEAAAEDVVAEVSLHASVPGLDCP